MKDLNYYMNLDYSYVITPIVEDDGEEYYQLSIPDLPGFKIYEDTPKLLLENLDDAKDAWFRANIEAGENIPEPTIVHDYSGRITLRTTKTLHEQLAFNAKRENVSLNSYINEKLIKGMSQDKSYNSILSLVKEEFKKIKSLIGNKVVPHNEYFIYQFPDKDQNSSIRSDLQSVSTYYDQPFQEVSAVDETQPRKLSLELRRS